MIDRSNSFAFAFLRRSTMIRLPTLLAFVLVCAALSTESSDAAEKTISVAIDTPASNYSIRIEEVYHVGKELWVISRVVTKGDFGLTVISKAKDSIKLDVPGDAAIRHKVLGKTWNWGKDTKQLTYVADPKSLQKQLKKLMAKNLFRRKSKPK